MLVAHDAWGNVVNLLHQKPENTLFYCPACKSTVRLKCGSVNRWHFAHVSLKDCHFYTENESEEHLSLKVNLYQSLTQTEEVEVEAYLSKIHQIADILVNGHLALEVQCSSLSYQRLQERSRNYQEKGYHVLWLLGKKLWLKDYITSLQKQFLYFSKRLGFYYWELDNEKGLVRLKYLIYQDIKGKLHYLEKTCSFDENVMAFLRLPYTLSTISQYAVENDEHLEIYIQKQLYYRKQRWLEWQSRLYKEGKNLLTSFKEECYPQVRWIASE